MRLNVFGTPSIVIRGKAITSQDYKAPMAWKLLVYLALNDTPHNAFELAAAMLQVDHANKTQADNIRSVIYRIRENLTKQIPQDLIINNNGYKLNPALDITTDAQEMAQLWYKAKHTDDFTGKTEYLKEAFGLYSGKVYSVCAHESWLIADATHYERMYLKIANMLFELLYKAGDYVNLQKYTLMATQIVHDDVGLTYWLIMSLIKSGNRSLAHKKFEEAQGILLAYEYDELNNRLREELNS